jgi:RNA methyltransferase, TrmH family
MHNKLTDELAVCGVNTVRALSEIHPDNINRLFLREDRLLLFTRLCKRLAERKRPYKLCDNEELERICKTSHHQGIVAMIYEPTVEPAAPEDLDAWAAEGKTGILLCNIGNDHNLGAIVRCAAFFDASPIILAGEGAAAGTGSGTETGRYLSTASYRVAEGGMEYVEFRSVRSPSAFLQVASKLLVTIGTDPRARIRVTDLPELIGKQAAGKKPGVMLVIGNEETGLPAEVKEQCSMLARIPGTGVLESLNAAQATALFLHELYERYT